MALTAAPLDSTSFAETARPCISTRVSPVGDFSSVFFVCSAPHLRISSPGALFFDIRNGIAARVRQAAFRPRQHTHAYSHVALLSFSHGALVAFTNFTATPFPGTLAGRVTRRRGVAALCLASWTATAVVNGHSGDLTQVGGAVSREDTETRGAPLPGLRVILHPVLYQ